MISGDRRRLQLIHRYCIDISSFINRFGNDFAKFADDRAYYNSIAMCVLQIGELANGLSEEFRIETKDEMPWGMIRGMRNWIAHAYAQMDEKIVWETATNDIPKLRSFCEKELNISHERNTSYRNDRDER